jgi:hypothetical protein
MKYIYVFRCKVCKDLQSRWFEEGARCEECKQVYQQDPFSFELALLTQLSDIEQQLRQMREDQ